MFNDPRAKDLLAQYPRQLAEGGAVDQPFQAPAVAPRGTALPAAASQTLAVAPRQRPTLTPVNTSGANSLSMSQQFARDRAAQDAMIRDAISKTGTTSPNTMNYRQLQQAVRAGDITGENIKQRFVDPELEARVRNAYAAIGRTGGVVPALEMPKKGGATADTYKKVRQDEYNYWADQLKQGKISPADFQNAFLTKAATDIPTTDLEAQRDYVNKARAALGMAALELPKKKSTGPFIGYNAASKSPVNIGMARIGPKLKPKAPVLPTQPIDLSGTAGTPVQLFNAGGEAVADQDPRAMDLEQFLLENSRMQAGPVDVQEVRSSRGPGKYDTRISKNMDNLEAFADVDVGDKKVSQLGARYAGRGRIGNYEVQYVLDPETKQPVITGAIRKELSPTSDVSAEGVYVPQKDGKDYYNAGVRYTKRFEDGGEVVSQEESGLSPEQYAKAIASYDLPQAELDAILSPTKAQKYAKEVLDTVRPGKDGIYGEKADVETMHADMYGNPSGRYFDTGKGVLNKINAVPKLPAAGVYTNATPDEVTVNVNSGLPSKNVFVHELQHKLDDDQASNRNNRLKAESFPEAYVRDLGNNKRWTDTSEDYSTLYDNVKNAYSSYRKKYKLSGDFKERGLIPELKRIESTLPVGMNIFDTDIGKAVSNGLPKFKFAYYNQTAPSKGTYMYSVDTAEQAGALRKAIEPESEKDIFAEPKRTVRALKEKVTDFIKTKK